MRTTITIPGHMLESLKTTAFHKKRTVSGLVREGICKVIDCKETKPGEGVARLIGKYHSKGKNINFDRVKFYDEIVRKKMSGGY